MNKMKNDITMKNRAGIQMVRLLIWITALIAPVSAFSQITGNVSKVGTVAASFLEIEVGSQFQDTYQNSKIKIKNGL